jgi:hypothetical protein
MVDLNLHRTRLWGIEFIALLCSHAIYLNFLCDQGKLLLFWEDLTSRKDIQISFILSSGSITTISWH